MTMRKRFEPRYLAEDDDGYASENAMAGAREQDDAFCTAMRKAIASGREHVAEGVKEADPNDIRVLPRPFVPATVLSGDNF